jgi:hypothetical protein
MPPSPIDADIVATSRAEAGADGGLGESEADGTLTGTGDGTGGDAGIGFRHAASGGNALTEDCKPVEWRPGVVLEKHLAFFGLGDDPFSHTLDPRYWYSSTTHEKAVAGLMYGIEARKGVMTLTGEAGTGKTLVLEMVADRLERESAV